MYYNVDSVNGRTKQNFFFNKNSLTIYSHIIFSYNSESLNHVIFVKAYRNHLLFCFVIQFLLSYTYTIKQVLLLLSGQKLLELYKYKITHVNKSPVGTK